MGKEKTEQGKEENTSAVSKGERIDKIQKLLQDRGKDAANIVRTWLHEDDNKKWTSIWL